jgi:hypothetical protein
VPCWVHVVGQVQKNVPAVGAASWPAASGPLGGPPGGPPAKHTSQQM